MKKIIQKAFNRFGYEIKKKKNYLPNINSKLNPEYLKRLINPKTVIDVGVGYGTPELYNAFPNAYFILVEPLKQFKPYIDEIKSIVDCEVHYKAASDISETRVIDVDINNLQKSSFKQRSELTKTNNLLEKQEVNTIPLKEIIKDNNKFYSPAILKIDTEGYELEVLKGCNNYLGLIDYIILEASVEKRFEQSYNFEDIIIFLNNKGFKLFDIPNIKFLDNKPGIQYMDIIFRNNKRKI